MCAEGNSRQLEFSRALEPVLAAVVADRVSPGVAVAVAEGGDLHPLVACAGRLTYDDGSPPVGPETIYDLASVTKLFTACVVMRLCASGLLDLETPVRNVLPDFRDGGRDEVTVGRLLSHTAGYPAWAPLYRTCASAAEVYAAVHAIPLEAPPGATTRYSDLGLILLGELLEALRVSTLDEMVATLVTRPLGLTDTCFRPPPRLHDRIAPTEDDPWRERVLRGDVHDENAAAMGGVAAHAGLFSTATDVAKLGATLLPTTRTMFIPRETADAFLAPRSDPGDGWVYGARRLADDPTFGRRLSPSAVGLTGFTGTLLVIDAEQPAAVAVLANRVHPTRRNEKIFGSRGPILDAVFAHLRR
jgi:serine-type D-Ala-D-Ala carboxypeptidase